MAGGPLPRGILAEVLQMCAAFSNSTWSQAVSFLTSQTAGVLLLTWCCHLLYVFASVWIWSQSVQVFSRLQRTMNATKLALRESTSTDRDWKDEIERLEAASTEEEGKGLTSKMNAVRTVHPSMIPVCVSVSDWNARRKLLENSEMVDAVEVKLERGCLLMQSEVELNSRTVAMLRNLAEKCTKNDKRFSAQLGRWRLFIRTPGGLKSLILDDAHEVPTILRASYAVGKLTIEGFNLDGAQIKAATADKCIPVKDIAKEKVGGLQIWTSVMRLPSNNLDEVFVYATKPVSVEDHNVAVCSSLIGVQDQNLNFVLRVGIPSTIGLIYVIVMYLQLFSLGGWRSANPVIVWILPLIALAATQIVPQSTGESIEVCIARIGLATASLYAAARRLFVLDQHPDVYFPEPPFRRPPLPLPPLPTAKSRDGEERKETKGDVPKFSKNKHRAGKMDKPKRGGGSGDAAEEEEGEPQCFVYEEYEDNFRSISVRKRELSQRAVLKRRLPFKFIHGLKRKMWVHRDYFKFHADTVVVGILGKLLPETFNFMGSDKLIIMVAEFFPLRRELKESLHSVFEAEFAANLDSAEADQVKTHLNYICQFVDTSSREVSDRYEAMKREGSVSYDMLWAFFPPNTKVAYPCAISGEELCGTARTVTYKKTAKEAAFIISLKTWDFNCQSWHSYSTCIRKIVEYPGRCDFTSLATHPLEFKTNPLEAENRFLAKGRWFCELSMLASNRFMHYEGPMYRSLKDRITKFAVSGRVMIGLASFAKMNPDYPMDTAAPPNDYLRTSQVELIDISERDDRMFAPTIVYGFSFQLKEWGAFTIDGFDDIVFNESAYEALVLDPTVKDTIYNLVHEYKRTDALSLSARERVDAIVGKGEGCILLCYGPPGTGKTFTAESISERLHAPLWSLSVSELGTSPAVLEERLAKVLDVAASWGAVLLLDEADVYLEKRETAAMDLERNAMTGIFIRHLEYYKGVLFLTTNRVVAFDDAFCSRISMFLYYENHSEEERKFIWENLLKPLKVKDLEAFLVTDYASFPLNAREIRNVVQVARTLARTKGEDLSSAFLRHSLETLAKSLKQLKLITQK